MPKITALEDFNSTYLSMKKGDILLLGTEIYLEHLYSSGFQVYTTNEENKNSWFGVLPWRDFIWLRDNDKIKVI